MMAGSVEQNRSWLDEFVCVLWLNVCCTRTRRDEATLWHERHSVWVGLSPGASSLLTSLHRKAWWDRHADTVLCVNKWQVRRLLTTRIRTGGMKLGLQLTEGLQLCGRRLHLLPRVHCAASGAGVPGLKAFEQGFLQFVLQFRSLPGPLLSRGSSLSPNFCFLPWNPCQESLFDSWLWTSWPVLSFTNTFSWRL